MKNIISVVVCFALIGLPLLAVAQDQHPPSSVLVPGSADTIHDVDGIAIGMSCDQAVAVAKQVSQLHGNYGQSRTKSRLVSEKNNFLFPYSRFEVPVRVTDRHLAVDVIYFDCLEDGGARQVFEIERRIDTRQGTVVPVGSLKSLFEEKYGVPSVEFGPFSFATIFNRHGIVSDKNACGDYSNGTLYLHDIGDSDPNKCSYAVVFTANVTRPPENAVVEIDIKIRDYLRLENAVVAMQAANQKTQSAPVNVPKL